MITCSKAALPAPDALSELSPPFLNPLCKSSKPLVRVRDVNTKIARCFKRHFRCVLCHSDKV